MKKVLLAVIATVIVGMTSCKKDEGAQPEVKKNVVLDKKENSTWD